MNLSKREKILVGAMVGMVLIGGSYMGLISPQINKYEALKIKHDEAQVTYEEFKSALLPSNPIYNQFTVIDNKVKDVTSLFFPELRQEKFIALLLTHLKAADISPNSIVFTKITEIKLIKEDDPLKDQGLADELVMQYQGVAPAEKPDEAAVTKHREETEKILKSLKMQKIGLTFRGSYSDLIALIQQIESYSRRITIEEITLTQESGQLVSTLQLGYYSIPKIHKDQDADFMAWDNTLLTGKKDPFSGNNLSVAQPKTQTSQTGSTNDFFMMLNPLVSDLTTVVMSKMGDKSRLTYIYADNAGFEPATIELIQKEGKYYYHYKTASAQYPQNYIEPVAFTPKSNVVNLQILSSPRVDAQDKSGVNLTVINKTNLKLVITVKNDDAKSRIKWTDKVGDIQIQ